ncbi:ATP-binding protein [Thermodesulfobacterium hveragerdense]|uniref:ATP-binding protein n=1 Tax=Thermodesulfobacterium hveragerdense TaxID=53424 RepID=UPI00041BA87B|nr:ATP-binding protein [Thermodesulfobacterium hveragerdense]
MVSKETIKEVIVENEKFILQGLLELYERENISLPSLDLKKVVVFYGVRRVGKTHLLYHLFRKFPEHSLYIDFEDERLVGLTLEDLDKIKEAFFELNPHLLDAKKVLFLFDEIQVISGWEKFVRRLVEKENIAVFCAGSSSQIIPKAIHTALRGRLWSVEVFPFSFQEFLRTKGLDPEEKKLFFGKRKILLQACLEEYLRFGGFPEVVLATTEFEKRKIIKDYLSAMFFRDFVEKYKIKNIPLFEALWDKLFTNYSTKFSLTAFYKQFKDKFSFSKDTLFTYYHYFLDSLLVYEVRLFSESSYKRLRNPAKIYLVDTGLCKRVTSPDLGRVLENIVFIELRRRGYDLYYFQHKSECDFIAVKEGEFKVYQVCWELTPENEKREITGALEAVYHLGLKSATTITFDQKGVKTCEGIELQLLPVREWLIRG